MNQSSPSLAALLGSRICHDLVSPIGAISNGVELLQMAGSSGGPELELIQESVENANARIRFFRIAFGLASPDQRMSASEVQDILSDLGRGTRLRIEWNSDPDLPRPEVKLVFLLIQCLEATLPWGGEISVTQEGKHWRIEGRSERMKDIGALWDCLEGGNAPDDISAAEVQFLLVPVLMAEAGRSLTLTRGSEGVTLSF